MAEHVITAPVPVTSVSPTTNVARQPSEAPVPCVPVEIAPEIVCTSMSPRFGIASPMSASASLSSRSRVPAPTVTSRFDRSAVRMPVKADMSRRMPDVTAAPVNECPAPTGLTVSPSSAAALIVAANSSTVVGRTTRAATVRWLPAQFDHADPPEPAHATRQPPLDLRRTIRVWHPPNPP